VAFFELRTLSIYAFYWNWAFVSKLLFAYF
jgi:hypothetical protein